jgi:hypothetical protein
MNTSTEFYTLFPWVKDLPLLSADSFIWEEYDADNSWLCHDPIVPFVEWTPIGRIDGNDLKVRPRPGVAVLFEDDSGRRHWQHVSRYAASAGY